MATCASRRKTHGAGLVRTPQQVAHPRGLQASEPSAPFAWSDGKVLARVHNGVQMAH